MNAISRIGDVRPDRRLRFPAVPVAGLAGTSFKHEHLNAILAEHPQTGFFEVHAENYMGAGGSPHRALEQIRRDHPISLHGVCMSIGGPQPLDQAHLARLPYSRRALRAGADFGAPRLVDARDDLFQRPAAFAVHASHAGASMARTSTKCRTPLRHRILVENPSTYVAFASSTMSETEFIRGDRAAAPAVGCCSTSTTCSSQRRTTAMRRSTICPIFPSAKSLKFTSPTW